MMTQFFQVLKRITILQSGRFLFYDDSILSGTKTLSVRFWPSVAFYDDSILSGTKTSNTTFYIKIKHMYLSFA